MCCCTAASHALYSICGILHGDIAPANCLWLRDKEGRARGVLNDFDHHRPQDIRENDVPQESPKAKAEVAAISARGSAVRGGELENKDRSDSQ